MKRELSILALAVGLAGCGSKANTCVPGQSSACVCSDGTGGAQVCRGDGTYAACACGTAVGNGGGGDVDMAGGVGGNGNSNGDLGGSGSSGNKRVFVTSTSYAGTVAASVCQSVAQSVNLTGTWIAWLSDGNHAGSSTPPDAIDLVKGSGPWLLLDGHVAFANHAQLATAPTVPIDVTETGQKVSGTQAVWTGTLTGGVHSGRDCSGWQISSYDGDVGSTATTATWTATGNQPICTSTAHVYCFEQ